MSGLREVIAAHELVDPEWSSVDCACGNVALKTEGGHSSHLATAVLAWIDERLTGAREDVGAVIAVSVSGYPSELLAAQIEVDPAVGVHLNRHADAALGVIRGALGEGA